jgi:hypothetical protein
MNQLPAQPSDLLPAGKGQDNASIFHDRDAGYFVRWMVERGLAPDAPDGQVVGAMKSHIDETGQHSIQSLPSQVAPQKLPTNRHQ